MGIEELIIVPHLYLHQMPFVALPVGGGSLAADGVTDVTDGVSVVNGGADFVADGVSVVNGGADFVADGVSVVRMEKGNSLSPTPHSPLPTPQEKGDNRGLVIGKKSPPSVEVKSSTYLGDKFRIRLIPSCQILYYCQQRKSSEVQPMMGIVEDATEDLIFTRYECETIAKSYKVAPEMRLSRKKSRENTVGVACAKRILRTQVC